MQVSLNNLAPPSPGIGLNGGPDTKGQPDVATDFKALVRERQRSAMIEGAPEKKGKVPNSPRENQSVAGSTQSKPLKVSSQSDKKVNEEETRDGAPIKTKAPKESKAKPSSSKGNAVLKFMDSLESELGISADRFSAALAQLPAEVKALPIEESAPYVVEQLGIPPTEQSGVADAYVNLLQKSGVLDKSVPNSEVQNKSMLHAEFFPTGQLPNITDASEMELPVKTSNRQKLNATIDELNRRFFDVKSKSPEGAISLEGLESVDLASTHGLAESLKSAGQVGSTPSYSPVALNEDLNKAYLDSLPQVERAQNPYKPISQGAQAVPDNSANQEWGAQLPISSLSDLEGMNLEGLNPQQISFVEGAVDVAGNKKVPLSNIKSWSVEELPFLANAQGGELSPMVKGFDTSDSSNGFQFGDDASAKFSSEEAIDSGEPLDTLSNAFTLANEDGYGKNINSQITKNATSPNVIASPQERTENLSKITNAAESLAGKGGGEMKVILTPEGMGTIQLKVKMQDGKLQVEMKAENRDSQRLIESSLNELKQSLSAHRLSVDSVKVDVGGDFTRQESAQSFSQPQFDMGREQAGQFMNFFREGNLSQRQTMFDTPGFKTYRSQKEEPLAPISTEVRPRASLSASKGKELNLVA